MYSAEALHLAVFFAAVVGFLAGGLLAIFICTGKPRA